MLNVKRAALAISAIVVCGPAYANDFPGARVEVNLGWDHVGAKISYSDSAAPANNASLKRSTDGVVYGAEVGYDYPISDGVYVGFLAGFDFASNKKCEAIYATSSACFSAKRNVSVGARTGMRVSPGYMAYVGGAFVNGKATVSYADIATPSDNFSFSDSRDGYRVIAGVEHRFVGNTYGKIEYRYSNYANDTVSSGTQSVSLGFDRHQVVAGVGVRF